MAVESIPEPRSRAEERPEGFVVTIPPRRHLFVTLFLPVWLGGWVFGEVHALRQLLTGEAESSSAFLLVWLVGWTVGGCAAALVFLWNLFGQQEVVLAPAELTIERQLIGLRRRRGYDVSAIRNLRVAPERSSHNGSQNPLADVIAFDYGAKTVAFGNGVDAAEARQILKQINTRFPSLSGAA